MGLQQLWNREEHKQVFKVVSGVGVDNIYTYLPLIWTNKEPKKQADNHDYKTNECMVLLAGRCKFDKNGGDKCGILTQPLRSNQSSFLGFV